MPHPFLSNHYVIVALGYVGALGMLGILATAVHSMLRARSERTRILKLSPATIVAVAGFAVCAFFFEQLVADVMRTRKMFATFRAVADAPVALTATHFESAKMPALVVDVPAGWSLNYESQELKATNGSSRGDATTVTYTTTMTSRPETHLSDIIAVRRLRFSDVEGPVATNLAGKPAEFAALRSTDRGELCIWAVHRDLYDVTVIECTSRAAEGCRTACAPAVEHVQLLKPAMFDATDL